MALFCITALHLPNSQPASWSFSASYSLPSFETTIFQFSNSKISATMDPSSQPLYSLHMQRLMVSDTLQDSEVNSEEPDMFNFLFHDVFVFGTQVSPVKSQFASLFHNWIFLISYRKSLLASQLPEKLGPNFALNLSAPVRMQLDLF